MNLSYLQLFASGFTTLEMLTDSNTALPSLFSIFNPIIDILLSKTFITFMHIFVRFHVSNVLKHSVAILVFNRLIIDNL